MSSPITEQLKESPDTSQADTGAPLGGMLLVDTRVLNWSSIVFAVLQSACTAVIAISGVRVAIGLPRMTLAFLGAILNLFVIWKVRNLRSKPAAQWRQQPVTKKKLNSERFQIALSVLTLLLRAPEWITHSLVHRVP